MAKNIRKYEVIYGFDLHDFEQKVSKHLATFADYDVRLEGGVHVIVNKDSPTIPKDYYQATSRTLNIVEE